jgi:hypothetical protein
MASREVNITINLEILLSLISSILWIIIRTLQHKVGVNNFLINYIREDRTRSNTHQRLLNTLTMPSMLTMHRSWKHFLLAVSWLVHIDSTKTPIARLRLPHMQQRIVPLNLLGLLELAYSRC